MRGEKGGKSLTYLALVRLSTSTLSWGIGGGLPGRVGNSGGEGKGRFSKKDTPSRGRDDG